jgi:chromosome segregation ATPase
MHRRGGTPLAAPPSLEASNQGQIDDLVLRNRTLEHKVKKLTEQLATEDTRAKGAVADIRKQWQEQQQEWREGCDILQACHNIVQLRNAVELEKERMVVMKEMEVVRQEKVKTLQRDFRITMFQAKEEELDGRIAELEDERETALAEYEEKIKKMKASCTGHMAQLKDKDEERAAIEQEKDDLEVLVLVS